MSKIYFCYREEGRRGGREGGRGAEGVAEKGGEREAVPLSTK